MFVLVFLFLHRIFIKIENNFLISDHSFMSGDGYFTLVLNQEAHYEGNNPKWFTRSDIVNKI